MKPKIDGITIHATHASGLRWYSVSIFRSENHNIECEHYPHIEGKQPHITSASLARLRRAQEALTHE